MFLKERHLRDISPFFLAIDYHYLNVIELFCDHGADLEQKTSLGLTPMMYAALKGSDDICMYLSLRC